MGGKPRLEPQLSSEEHLLLNHEDHSIHTLTPTVRNPTPFASTSLLSKLPTTESEILHRTEEAIQNVPTTEISQTGHLRKKEYAKICLEPKRKQKSKQRHSIFLQSPDKQ